MFSELFSGSLDLVFARAGIRQKFHSKSNFVPGQSRGKFKKMKRKEKKADESGKKEREKRGLYFSGQKKER